MVQPAHWPARPKMMVQTAKSQARWVISPAIVQTATGWNSYLNKLWLTKMPQKPTLDSHAKTRHRYMPQPVERKVGSLVRQKRQSRRRTARRRASWKISHPCTFKWDKAKEIRICGWTSHIHTIMYRIIKQKGWEIRAQQSIQVFHPLPPLQSS